MGLTLFCSVSPAQAQTVGEAQSFAIVGGTGVTAASGASQTLINGDVGVSPGTSITGFPANATTVPPYTTHSNDGQAINAQTAAGNLYNTIFALPAGIPIGPELSNLNLGPNTYSVAAGATLSAAGGPLTGNLTLTGAGTYIFKLASSITAAVGTTMTLVGVDPCMVFWQVDSAATLNGVNFVGNVVAEDAVNLGSNAVLTGRAMTTPAGSVSMAGNNTVGGCSIAAQAPTPPLPTPLPPLSGPPSLGKGFNQTIAAGGVSTLVITLTNPNAAPALLIASLVDTLPAGLMIAATPNAGTTCPGIGVVVASPGSQSVTLPATHLIPAAADQAPGSCTVFVNVTAPASGSFTNTLPVGALRTSNGNNGGAAVAVLVVGAAPTPVPTLSEWAVIGLSLLLALTGFAAMRRRNT